MITKNRYFKNTLGVFAELVIASALDTEETNAIPATPATVAVPVTIAADPTPGDTITITVDGVPYTHTVPVGDETTQAAHDAIAALLVANAQGFEVVSHTGTTSSVYNLAWAGADKNTKVVSLAETGSTFTTGADVAFAGGVDADAAATDNWKAFVENANAGTIWAFWSDEDGKQTVANEALVAGDTSNPANAKKSFFYGWKDASGVAHKTTSIPVAGLKYDSAPYNAGQAQIKKVKYGGTIAVTQRIHVRITETTATVVPYPTWEYDTPVVDTVDNAVAALVTAINAEKSDPIVTATSSTDTLTLTGKYKERTFAVSAFIEVSPTQTADASAITFPTSGTQPAKAPVGDLAAIKELEKYYWIYNGGINYAPEGTSLEEWQNQGGSNIGAIAQWGTLLVSAFRKEKGVTNDHVAYPYVIVCVPTGSETTLKAL
jgi:hypothetical protein